MVADMAQCKLPHKGSQALRSMPSIVRTDGAQCARQDLRIYLLRRSSTSILRVIASVIRQESFDSRPAQLNRLSLVQWQCMLPVTAIPTNQMHPKQVYPSPADRLTS